MNRFCSFPDINSITKWKEIKGKDYLAEKNIIFDDYNLNI